jgi:hypothetical protein
MPGWVGYYNTERPHQALGMRPPMQRFQLAVGLGVETVVEPRCGSFTRTYWSPNMCNAANQSPASSRRSGCGGAAVVPGPPPMGWW